MSMHKKKSEVMLQLCLFSSTFLYKTNFHKSLYIYCTICNTTEASQWILRWFLEIKCKRFPSTGVLRPAQLFKGQVSWYAGMLCQTLWGQSYLDRSVIYSHMPPAGSHMDGMRHIPVLSVPWSHRGWFSQTAGPFSLGFHPLKKLCHGSNRGK